MPDLPQHSHGGVSDLVVSDVDDQRGLSWLQLSPNIIGELCRAAPIEKIGGRAN